MTRSFIQTVADIGIFYNFHRLHHLNSYRSTTDHYSISSEDILVVSILHRRTFL
jgi:hypothetical protein